MSLTINALPPAQEVKNATQTLHTEVEQILRPRLTSISTVNDYADILKMFYGFFQPLENSVQQRISSNDLPDIKERRKAAVILHDLKQLSQSTTNISLCSSLPFIANRAQAFGALYVMEGSTLGGKMIAKMLLKNAVVPKEALNFFTCYKEETGRKWKGFLHALNQQQEVDEIIQTANDTFLHLKKWMEQRLSS